MSKMYIVDDVVLFIRIFKITLKSMSFIFFNLINMNKDEMMHCLFI